MQKRQTIGIYFILRLVIQTHCRAALAPSCNSNTPPLPAIHTNGPWRWRFWSSPQAARIASRIIGMHDPPPATSTMLTSLASLPNQPPCQCCPSRRSRLSMSLLAALIGCVSASSIPQGVAGTYASCRGTLRQTSGRDALPGSDCTSPCPQGPAQVRRQYRGLDSNQPIAVVTIRPIGCDNVVIVDSPVPLLRRVSPRPRSRSSPPPNPWQTSLV